MSAPRKRVVLGIQKCMQFLFNCVTVISTDVFAQSDCYNMLFRRFEFWFVCVRCQWKAKQSMEMKHYELKQCDDNYILVCLYMELGLEMLQAIAYLSNLTSFALFVHVISLKEAETMEASAMKGLYEGHWEGDLMDCNYESLTKVFLCFNWSSILNWCSIRDIFFAYVPSHDEKYSHDAQYIYIYIVCSDINSECSKQSKN